MWRLLTNRSVSTLKEAAELIDWHRARWDIEVLFLTLKAHRRRSTDRPTGQVPGRKGDGEPGVKTIWLGLQRVMDFTAGIKHAHALQEV